jgi:hypothetical protein
MEQNQENVYYTQNFSIFHNGKFETKQIQLMRPPIGGTGFATCGFCIRDQTKDCEYCGNARVKTVTSVQCYICGGTTKATLYNTRTKETSIGNCRRCDAGAILIEEEDEEDEEDENGEK